LAASSSGRPAATTKATNIALQQLLRSVDSLCQDLPALPSKYTSNCGSRDALTEQ
jgi:hypothetical protein